MVGEKDVVYVSLCGGVRYDDVLSGSSCRDCPFRRLILIAVGRCFVLNCEETLSFLSGNQ